MTKTSGTAQVEIAVEPATVWNYLTDLSNMEKLSPECYKSEWEGGASEAKAGAQFHGYNAAGDQKWDTVCTVICAEPGMDFSFAVVPPGMQATIWRYLIDPSEGGSVVTESFDAPAIAAPHFVAIDRHSQMVANIEQTLERLKQQLEG